ncbi:MAG: hypothetical protein QW069_09190 [Candidatus Caldarchaeum sp.]
MVVIWSPDTCGTPPCVIEVKPDGTLGDHLYVCDQHRKHGFSAGKILEENRDKNKAVEIAAKALGRNPEEVEWTISDDMGRREIIIQPPAETTSSQISSLAEKLSQTFNTTIEYGRIRVGRGSP